MLTFLVNAITECADECFGVREVIQKRNKPKIPTTKPDLEEAFEGQMADTVRALERELVKKKYQEWRTAHKGATTKSFWEFIGKLEKDEMDGRQTNLTEKEVKKYISETQVKQDFKMEKPEKMQMEEWNTIETEVKEHWEKVKQFIKKTKKNEEEISMNMTEKEIQELMKKRKVTAVGPDETSGPLIKMLADTIAPWVRLNLQDMAKEGMVSENMLDAYVTMLIKDWGKSLDAETNFRYLTVASCLGKVFEESIGKLMGKQLREETREEQFARKKNETLTYLTTHWQHR